MTRPPWMPPKQSKYRAKRVEGPDGQVYASKLEAKVATELRLLKQAGAIHDFLEQVSIRLTPKVKYVCDFMVIDADGVRFIECKGFETEAWRIKHRLLQDLRPEIAKRLTVRKR